MNIINPNAHHNLLARLSAEFTAPWSYLEIGCCEGASLLTVLRSGAPTSSIVCDNWGTAAGGSGRGSNAHIKALLAAEPKRHDVKFVDGDSKITVPKLVGPFNLINIDGDHSYVGAAMDLFHCWPLLIPGGILVLDDIYHPQHVYLKQLVERFSVFANCAPFFTDKADYGVCAWRKPLC